MKRLIDITDEDVIKVIDSVHILTENRVISRKGLHGLSFDESFKKYGSCYIEIEMVSNDVISDGHFTVTNKCRLKFHHNSVWIAEMSFDGKDSNYNKNHFFGYLKLKELGYGFPTKPQM